MQLPSLTASGLMASLRWGQQKTNARLNHAHVITQPITIHAPLATPPAGGSPASLSYQQDSAGGERGEAGPGALTWVQLCPS